MLEHITSQIQVSYLWSPYFWVVTLPCVKYYKHSCIPALIMQLGLHFSINYVITLTFVTKLYRFYFVRCPHLSLPTVLCHSITVSFAKIACGISFLTFGELI
jgi:hypothetical protein